MSSARYRVGELAHLCGVNPRTIDYYTTVGLLAPVERSSGGHRLYDESTIHRLRTIKALQAQGASLETIRERLAMASSEGDLLPRIEQLRAELRRLEGEVAELTPRLTSAEGGTRRALQASLASAAMFALTVAQELMEVLNNSGLGSL